MGKIGKTGRTVSVAALLVLAGCANSTTKEPATVPAQSSPTSDPSSGVGRGPAGGPVPKGFTAQDLTFVSTTNGWLLGTAPCSAAPCTSIVHTTDGGKTWAGIPAPKADLEPNGQNGCGDKACVRGLRFGDPTTGYAYGSTAWYLTNDGGGTWTKLDGQANALEIANGSVIRVSSNSQACPPGCTYQLTTAPLGSSQFTAAKVSGGPGQLLGNNVQLLRQGHNAYLELFANTAGGGEDAHAQFLTSNDDGKSWTVRKDPCGTYQGTEADSTRMAVADDGSLTVLCSLRTGQSSFVITSTDGGGSFGPQHAVSQGGGLDVGAASGRTLMVVTAQTQTDQRAETLLRSADAGSTWTPVATTPIASPDDLSNQTIGFQNGTAGQWTPGGNEVFHTTDGGTSWQKYTFTK
jgi:photosystem II stability/assembly factor-like uncharacterized protein